MLGHRLRDRLGGATPSLVIVHSGHAVPPGAGQEVRHVQPSVFHFGQELYRRRALIVLKPPQGRVTNIQPCGQIVSRKTEILAKFDQS